MNTTQRPTAKKLAALRIPQPATDTHCPQPISTSREIVLSDEQEAVAKAAQAGQSILITGEAGTGKSMLLGKLVEKFGGRLPVTATTGIAAVNVQGVTLHSWAGLGMGDQTARQIAARINQQRAKHYLNITGFNRLAIDEISMLSAELMNKVDEVFRIVRRNDRPFGGMQLILFGDFLQLPPVIKNPAEEAHGVFAFQSRAWQDAGIRVAMLRKVFRQTDLEFSQALSNIRVGNCSERARAMLNSRFRKPDPDPTIEPVIVHTHNVDVEDYNEGRLNELPGKVIEYKAQDTGRESAIKLLEKNCLAPTLLRLKEGAQVMLLANVEPESGLANGSIGRVESFAGGDSKRPVVRFTNGLVRELERQSWQIKDDGRVLAERFQIPLRLAWSITAHKSQGMSLDKIKVFLAKCFAPGQAYVALSRARTLPGLFIESGSRDSIKASEDAVRFYAEAQPIQ